MTNLLLIFANEFKKVSLQVSTFASERWKEIFELFILANLIKIHEIQEN